VAERYQPGKQAADDPETLPAPAFYFFIRHVKTTGSETAYEMENNTEDNTHEQKFSVWLSNSIQFTIFKTINNNISLSCTVMVFYEFMYEFMNPQFAVVNCAYSVCLEKIANANKRCTELPS
jgi:hypothetical protein